MNKGRIILCIVTAVLFVGLLVTGIVLSQKIGNKRPEETTSAPTTEAPTDAGETTQATTQPTETTEPQKRMYWVFAYGGLRVRKGPSTEYVLAGSLDDGEVVEVLEWKDGWAYIEAPVQGWCSGEFLHELGWYKDVKTPVGTPPEDTSLRGKWVHITTPNEKDGFLSCTAGIFRLRSDGTFIHRVDEYRMDKDGKWEAVNTLVDHPYWVGEYSFDGKTLVLNYMAELQETYDTKTGKPKTREWVEWIETLTLEVTREGSDIGVADAVYIPLTVANEHAQNTEKTLYRAPNDLASPEDVCAVLSGLFKGY